MTWDSLSEILDVESSLQTRSKKSTEWSNQTGEGSHGHDVELDRADFEHCSKDWLEPEWDVVGVWDEDWVWLTLKAGPNVRSEVLDWTDEVAVADQDVGHKCANDDCAEPGSNKSFNSLLGGDFDELGSAEGDTADVGKYVVGDDEGNGEEEPDHAFKDVVDDELGLNDNKVEGQMSPCELSKLELVVTLLERCDE